MSIRFSAASTSRFLLAAIVIAATVGCYNNDNQIRSYTVDKPAEIEPVANEQGEAQRMLAAIMLPGGDAWFFKLSGPVDAVGRVEEETRALIESVTFSGGKPNWKAPEAWQQQPGNEFRYATLLIPNGESKPLELSISTLPHADSDTYVLDNVNRWRGQLGQSPLTLATLPSGVDAFEVEGVPTTWVDITGAASAGGMRPPFMAGGPGNAPVAESLTKKPAATQVPPEEPVGPLTIGPQPVGPVRPPATIDSGGLTFEKPATWTQKEGSGIRRLAFDVAGNSGTGEVTVIPLGSQGGELPGGLLANVNRWRGQVQLPPLAADQLDAAVEPATVGKEEARLVELIGPEQGILCAIVARADKTWCIKLQGDSALAKAQRENFEAFLTSLELD